MHLHSSPLFRYSTTTKRNAKRDIHDIYPINISGSLPGYSQISICFAVRILSQRRTTTKVLNTIRSTLEIEWPQPNPVIHVVANPVLGLLDRKRSEEHLPSSNESKRKHKHTKNDKKKGTAITKYTGQKKINEGHSIERVWHSASREPSYTLPGSQPCTQKTRSIYHIPYSKGFSFTNGTIDVA